MQYFDDFNPEEEINKDTKLGILEKDTILKVVTAVEMLANKAKGAKTYGDLYKIINKVSKFIDEQEDALGKVSGEEDSDPKAITDEEKQETREIIDELAKKFHEHMDAKQKEELLHHAKSKAYFSGIDAYTKDVEAKVALNNPEKLPGGNPISKKKS
jgi:hypothetical protein